MQTGSNLEKAKIYNERLVLDLIRMHGALSRSELSRRTALTPPTVSNIINSLLRQDLVIETGQVKGPRGSPSVLFSLNPAGALSIGINLDRDHAGAVLLDLTGQVVAEVERDIDLADEPEVRREIRTLLRHLTSNEQFELSRLLGVGVGIPAATRVFGALSNQLRNDVVDTLEQAATSRSNLLVREQIPIYIENNANAAALGEYWYGDGSSYSSFFYLLFGVGLGGGVVLNGSVHRGANDYAGEIGRTPIFRGGEPGLVGREARGGSEAGSQGVLASVGGDAPLTSVAVLEDVASLGSLCHALEIDRKLGWKERSAATAELALNRDPRFQEWLETAASHLAEALVHVECLIDPQAFVLGGRLPPSVLEPLATRLAERLAELRHITGKPTAAAVVTGRAGSKAGSLGVGVLPLYETIAPKHDLLQKTPLDSPDMARLASVGGFVRGREKGR